MVLIIFYISFYSLTCTDGCNPDKGNNDAKIEMKCDTKVCSNIMWYIQDYRNEDEWDVSLKADLDIIRRDQVALDL